MNNLAYTARSVLCLSVLALPTSGAPGFRLPAYIPSEYLNDEYFVTNQARQAPEIDGELSDACWDEALELYPFSTLGGGGALAVLQTRAKVTWDDQGFYVAYFCEQPDMELARRRGDHFEIFFMPLYPDQPPHVNHATSLLMMAHHKPEEFHYQQARGAMGGAGGIYFQKEHGVRSAGKVGDDWWTWEGFIPFKSLWVRGLPPPDSSVTHWRIGFNRWSNYHGEIGWYGSMISSLNHQMNHCPVFRLGKPRTAPSVALSHPMQGGPPGEFSVTVTHRADKEAAYRVKVLRRKEPFDPDLTEAQPNDNAAQQFTLMPGTGTQLHYRVPYRGWRNQYRVEVWDDQVRVLYFRSLWYSLGEPLTHAWDSERPQLGLLPEPKQVWPGKGSFSLGGETRVLTETGNDADRLAAESLSKPIGFLSEPWPSFSVSGVAARLLPQAKAIVVGALGSPIVTRLLQDRDVDLQVPTLPEQGYLLVIDRKFVLVAGGGAAGTFYGVQTLRQLVMQNRKALPSVTVIDWPDLDWRGAWHTFRVTPDNIDLACLFKINVGGLSHGDKKRYHFRPFIFGAHTWFGHTGGSLVPEQKREPVRGEAVICPASSCAEELTACIDRFAGKVGLDATEMTHVFVGADEAPFGLDPRCQAMIDAKGAGHIVAHHFRDNMYAACAARGKRMCCWADALLCAEASLNTMPKDFHPIHWMYYPSLYFGGCDLLGKHKLPFVVAPMTRGENSYKFPQIRSRELNIATLCRHAAHEGGKGVWLTTWGGGLDDDLLWYSYLLAAEYGWSAGPDLGTFRRKFGRLLYGSERGGGWLLELERLTALYLTKKLPEAPTTLAHDSARLDTIRHEIDQVLARDWYAKGKLLALQRIIESVDQGIQAYRNPAVPPAAK